MGATALILAAGEGTRMKSALPKVAHEVLGVPLVAHVVDATRGAGTDRVVVVTGHGADAVESLLSESGVEFARQERRLGTGHAVICALEVTGALEGPVVVLSGDVPLVRPETIERLMNAQAAAGAACVLLSAVFSDPAGYGRIIRDANGSVTAIIEHKDLPQRLVEVREANVGIYCFDGAALTSHLSRLDTANSQGEYYLTDLVALLVAEGLPVHAIVTDDVDESHGVNTRVQLAEVTRVLQRRINERHMLSGVTMTDPSLVWVGPHVTIGPDTVIEPMTFLYGSTSIGRGCRIGPDSRVVDSTTGDGCTIDSSIVMGASLADDVSVGPRAYLRPGTVMERRSRAGTSVEISKSRIGEGATVPHLSYIGDADIGRGANLGAGTITCDHGAGSVITKDVPADALAVERSEQRVADEWASRRRVNGQEGEQGSGATDDLGTR